MQRAKKKKNIHGISLQNNHTFIFSLNFGMKKIVLGEKQYFTGWNRCSQSASGVEKAAVFYNGRNSMWHVENELLSQAEISLVLMAWDIQWRVLPLLRLSLSSPCPDSSLPPHRRINTVHICNEWDSKSSLIGRKQGKMRAVNESWESSVTWWGTWVKERKNREAAVTWSGIQLETKSQWRRSSCSRWREWGKEGGRDWWSEPGENKEY